MKLETKPNKGGKLIIIGVIAIIIISIVGYFAIGSFEAVIVKGNIKLGSKYLEEGKYDKAIIKFQRAIELDPSNTEIVIQLAKAYAESGDLENAVKLLEETIFLDKKNHEPYIALADIYLNSNKYVEAKLMYLRGILESPNQEPLKQGLDKLIASVEVPELNVTLEKNQNYSLPSELEVNINGSKQALKVKWDTDKVDSSSGKDCKIRGSIEIFDKPVILNIQFKKVPVNKEVTADNGFSVSQEELEKIGLFLSNFTELGLNEFNVSNYNIEDLIYFGIWHNYINNSKTTMEFRDGKSFINKKYVEQSIKKYTNIDLKEHKTVARHNFIFEFIGEEYKYIPADGGLYPQVKVDKVIDKGSGIINVQGKLYSNEEQSEGFFGSVNANITKVEDRYCLVSISVNR